MTRRATPDDWRDLQRQVATILSDAGMAVETEKTVQTARGHVEVDVHAEDRLRGRRYVVAVECKHWRARVPQTVIHAFRTVVSEMGANAGYLVSSSGFQSGAMTAAELTNVRLVTWEEFQAEFASDDQRRVNELLGLLTRSSMRLIAEQSFYAPWPDRITTPLDFLVQERDEAEHRFADPLLEERRRELIDAAVAFREVEALNGFESYVPERRDGGWTPAQAEGHPDREKTLARRSLKLTSAAEAVTGRYDDLVTAIDEAGYSIEAMTGAVHHDVARFDREVHSSSRRVGT